LIRFKVASTNKMRRSQGYNYQPVPSTSQSDMLETENEQMTEELRNKIHKLKHLSINIGDEVRYQNQMLNEFDDDVDKTGGFLSTTMNRVKRLGRGGHRTYWCYMFLFALLVFFLLYLVLMFR